MRTDKSGNLHEKDVEPRVKWCIGDHDHRRYVQEYGLHFMVESFLMEV